MTEISEAIRRLRESVCRLNQELPRQGLVVWTAGNVSARVPGEQLMLIKPSGLDFDQLTPESMVLTDLSGSVVEGDLRPSSDAGTHAYVYRHLPDVGGIVHSHSTFACAWAARAQPIPCVLTMVADEFGGDIPIGPFALIGDEEIGRGIVETLRDSRSPGVIMQNHGPFTIGPDARTALKAAVMLEECAKAVHYAFALGEPVPIGDGDIAALNDRYRTVYGQ